MSMLKTTLTKLLETATTSNTISKQGRIICYFIAATAVIIITTLLPELVFAAKFDIDAGVKAATDPLIKGINDHWGKAVLLSGTAGAIIGEGDARQRAVRAGITSAASGGVVLALLAMLS